MYLYYYEEWLRSLEHNDMSTKNSNPFVLADIFDEAMKEAAKYNLGAEVLVSFITFSLCPVLRSSVINASVVPEPAQEGFLDGFQRISIIFFESMNDSASIR